MKRYTVAAVRAHIADALDQVERGGDVVIERRGVRFRLVVETASSRKKEKPRPFFEVLDPGLDDGWTWVPGPDGQLELVVGGRTRADARKAMAKERARASRPRRRRR